MYEGARLIHNPDEEKILEGARSFTAQIKSYYFLHLTQISNLSSIFKNGLFCRATLLHDKRPFRNLAKNEIIMRRGKWDRFVPLFFVPRTAMLHHVQNDGDGVGIDEICFINIEVPVICQRVEMGDGTKVPSYVTDGNAASAATRYFEVTAELKSTLHNNIDKEILLTPNCYSRTWRRRHAAEILIPWKIESPYLKSVVVFNRDCRNKAKSVLGKNSEVIVKEEKDYFFSDL